MQGGSVLGVALFLAVLVPPAAAAGYQASARSEHPDAIKDQSRNWTYRGDVVRVSFRNPQAVLRKRQRFTSCYTRGPVLDCRTRTLFGRRQDSWFLRISSPWAGYVGRRHTGYIEFTWRVRGKVVARARTWIYESD